MCDAATATRNKSLFYRDTSRLAQQLLHGHIAGRRKRDARRQVFSVNCLEDVFVSGFSDVRRSALIATAVAAMVSTPSALAAVDPALEAQLKALSARVQQLEAALARAQAPLTTAAASPTSAQPPAAVEQRVRVLERKIEVAAEESAAARVKTPAVSLGEKGLAVATPDGNFEARLRGYVQIDGRFFHDDKALTGSAATQDAFLARRIRPIFEGTVARQFYYRVMPDFAGSAVTLQDAYAEWRQLPYARVTVGKFKAPFGLERLGSATELAFVERGLTNNLVPNRDFGVQVGGEWWGKRVSYQIGVFNGVPDLGSTGPSDLNDDKDFAGRVFFQPFIEQFGPLQGLGFGLAGSYGEEQGNETATGLGSYVTPGQAKFFGYRSTPASLVVNGDKLTLAPSLASTVVGAGERTRYSPQGFWYWRQFGVFGDYVESSQEVALDQQRARLSHSAWQVSGSLVLTGEEASFKGVKPKAAFDPVAGDWGALELVGRYGELDIDQQAFDGGFADPVKSASAASAWGLGLNWYLNRHVKLVCDYDETAFVGGGGSKAAPGNRPNERVVLSRVQLSY